MMSVTFVEDDQDKFPLTWEDLEPGETYLDNAGDVVIPLDKTDPLKLGRGVKCPAVSLSDGMQASANDLGIEMHANLRYRQVDLEIKIVK
jgi:hypothetical protein